MADGNTPLKEFEGKSIIVTGAAAGMGKAIAESFLQNGGGVVAVDFNQDALHTFQRQMEEQYGKAVLERLVTFCGDVSRQEVNEQMVERAGEAFGSLDVLVNNAGVAGHSEPITETTNEDWNRILDIDLTGPMYGIRAAVNQMQKQPQGGNIVTIASVAGIRGCRSSVAYTVAKHGLVGLCEHTAYAYMHKGIRSNIVCPGAIRTGMTSKPELESAFGRERILSGMDSNLPYGEPQDIAQTVLFLASDRARFINGATFVVDGGVSCN